MNKPLILISNDDDITSKGIRTLVEVMSELGEVVVVAPDTPQSGKGHAITLGSPLRLKRSDIFGESIQAYECNGTPADCVKLGKHLILKNKKPDLVVSGINHGSNSSVSVLYSGTMSAAIEAAMEGLPSIGFSLCDYMPQADFSHIRTYVKEIAQKVMEKGLPAGVALNVNFPKISEESINGIKWSRQANAVYRERFEKRVDPYGRPYYWMDGDMDNHDALATDTDEWALANNYISIVPCKYDLTDYAALTKLSEQLQF
ncbi:MAG: 5'/3'-nucleotidase SurE [Spirosomataceae bacterium]